MKKYIITILLLVATMLSLKASNSDGSKYIPIMTPESATLGQFGAFPVSLYTGSVNVSIPIHTLKTSNISVPIAIQYNGTGLIPGKHCGKIGHDWNLVAGGAITRTVKGVPDEWGSTGSQDYELYGILHYINSYTESRTNEDIRNLVDYKTISANNEAKLSHETTPDVFSFNFLGHTGQFMIDHDGTVKVVGKQPYKVLINDIKLQTLYAPQQISSITIIDGEGTKYTFGGNIHALEISLKKQPGINTAPFLSGIITAFYLTKVETTNGETVNFIYCQENSSDDEIFDANTGFNPNRYTVSTPYYADFYENIHLFGSWEAIVGTGAISPSLSYTKGAYLHKIISSQGETVDFIYENREYPFSNVLDSEERMRDWNNITNIRLDRIQATNSTGDIVMYASVSQSYKQASAAGNVLSYRMFLDTVVVNQNKYAFEYYNTGAYPKPHTRGIDLNGFYNGNDSNTILLGSNSSGDEHDFSHRTPSFLNAVNGMLKRITYPTGGNTHFTYEGHQYGKAVALSVEDMAFITSNTSGNIGGVRIKEIANTPGDTLTYEYVNENSQSSGVINDIAKYKVNLSSNPQQLWNVTGLFVLSGNNLMAGHMVSEPHIGYSRVIERRGKGNGHKVYRYTTFDDYKDQPKVDNDSNTVYNYGSNIPASTMLGYLHPTSMHLDRGKLISLEEYDKQGNLIKETTYNYYDGDDRKSDAIYSAGCRLRVNDYYLINSVAHYYYPKHLTSMQVRERLNGQWHTTQTDYTYNQHNQLVSEETVSNSSGDIHTKKRFYPKDIAATTVISAMIGQNMLNTVVKEEHYCNNVLTRAIENEFAVYSGITDTSGYYDICAVKETVKADSTYYLARIHSRDKYRNIGSITEFGKPTVSYLWSYNGLYPIVKLENVTSSQIGDITSETKENILHSTNPYDSNSNGASTLAQLENMFSGAMITRYDYKPQVGMTSYKRPDGVTYLYNYDNVGRLSSIARQQQNQIIKKFDYNVVHNGKLKAYWKNASATFGLGSSTLICAASGGSKDYTFESLTLKKGNLQVASAFSDRITYNFTSEGTYTFSGTVRDNITGEVSSFSNAFSVTNPQEIEFTNIDDHQTIEYGTYASTATIECDTPITVSFSLIYSINESSSDERYFYCTIGDEMFTTDDKEDGSMQFTVELAAGTNYIELYMGNIIGNGFLDLIINSVDGNNVTLGTNLFLSVSIEKIN